MKRFTYTLVCAAMTAALTAPLASCSNDFDAVESVDEFVGEEIKVCSFPAFTTDATTRAVDEKTSWTGDDTIYVQLNGEGEWYALSYADSKWSAPKGFSMKKSDTYKAVYAPNYELNSAKDALMLKSGKTASTAEYLTCEGTRPINISFVRNYSRLRLSATANSTISVSFGDGFTANNGSDVKSFSLTTDKDGDAYVYGKWGEKTSLSITSIVSGDPSTDVSYIGASSNKTIKSASGDNKAYVVAAPTDIWYVYNLDKATESKIHWADAVDAGYKKIKVIGAWDSNKAPSFQYNYLDNESASNENITSIDLGDVTGLTYIPDNFCEGVYFMTKVILPDGVETIGENAFRLCCKLENINLPNTLKEIKANGLNYCTLTNITSLPESLETIGDGAFANSNIYFSSFPENVKNIGTSVFKTATFWTTSFEWPKNIAKIPDNTFNNSSDLNLTIPSSVTEIGASAFKSCYGLVIKCMATSVPTLGSNAFNADYGVTYSLYVPSSSLEAYQSAWGNYPLTIYAIEE